MPRTPCGQKPVAYRPIPLTMSLVLFQSICCAGIQSMSLDRNCDHKRDINIDEPLIEEFNKLMDHYDVTNLYRGLHAPPDDKSIVDYDYFEQLKQMCEISSDSDKGFYGMLDEMVDKRARATLENNACPWVFVSNYDVDRLPVNIPETRCVCDRCLEKLPRGENVFRYVPRLGRCKPVKSSVVVLRRHWNVTSGLYDYEPDTEKIAVGCTCTRPDVIN
ncbi:Interleukin 17B [Mactra antiquata]